MTELSVVAVPTTVSKMILKDKNGFIFNKFHELHYISNFEIIYVVFLDLLG
jgi:hypothetical protein